MLDWLNRPDASFIGNFDGQNNTITNLYINLTGESDIGLFGRVALGSSITNLGLIDANVTGQATTSNTGILVGFNKGTINNSYSTGSVFGRSSVGGLVGSNDAGTIENSYSEANVTGSTTGVGGLVGQSIETGIGNTFVINSYATGNLSGNVSTSRLGGLVGTLEAEDGSTTIRLDNDSKVLIESNGKIVK